MAKSIGQIKSQMLKAEKNPRQKGILRKQLVGALEREVDRLDALLKAAAEAPKTISAVSGPYSVGTLSVDLGAQDPFQTDEWRFLERCCAEMDIELARGVTTNLAKKIYDKVGAKFMAYRTMKEIVAERGVGAEWVPFAVTGRDPNTGNKRKLKAVEPAPEPEKAPRAPDVTAGGMPVRSDRPSPDAILAAVTGGDPRAGMRAELEARPEPEPASTT